METAQQQEERPAEVLPTLRPSAVVRKAVDALAIVPTRDKISLLTRKIYNVMMHHAQAQGSAQMTYRARLKDVIHLVDFNSNNTELLKEYFRSMVTTKVEWQSPTRSEGEGATWGVSGMIAHAEFVPGGAGEVMLEWSYSPKLQQAILDPQRYARISLSVVAQLRTHAALALYEICSRYVDNPAGLTARNHWSWWRPVLTGSPDSHAETYKEWKYFKRDCIAKAVAEVNHITDIDVEAIEHKQGRAMGDLQFAVRRKAQQKLPLSALPSPVDLQLIGRAINSGVSQARAEKLFEKYGSDAMVRALDQLESRQQRTAMEPVRSAEKYLAALLSSPAEVAPIEDKGGLKKIRASRIALLESYRARRRSEAESLFNEMPADDQKQLLQGFAESLRSNPAVAKTYEKRGLDAPMTRAVFTRFVADSLFGDGWDNPSDTVLLDHAIA
jgi:hypothetical protein